MLKTKKKTKRETKTIVIDYNAHQILLDVKKKLREERKKRRIGGSINMSDAIRKMAGRNKG